MRWDGCVCHLARSLSQCRMHFTNVRNPLPVSVMLKSADQTDVSLRHALMLAVTLVAGLVIRQSRTFLSTRRPSGSPTTFRKTMNENHSEHSHHNHGDDHCQHKHSHGDHGGPATALSGKYTCPMDPEVRSRAKPGACPKCGMALEPECWRARSDDIHLSRCTPESAGRTRRCPKCGMALEPRIVTRGRRMKISGRR